jgi:hypothetical protein
MKLPAIAFGSTGLLIGLIVAFSSDQLSRIVIPLLFAIFGGSVVAFGKDLTQHQRDSAYVGLAALSTSCLIGIVVGILCVQHQWLGPGFGPKIEAERKVADADSAAGGTRYYLRAQTLNEIDAIQTKVSQKQLDKSSAYDEVITTLRQASSRQ